MTHQKQGNNELHFFYDSNSSIVGFSYNGNYYTYIKNLQGDVTGVIDDLGNTVANYSYDAWGNVTSQSGTLADINPIRYKGYYYDSDIGMYYLQSRYYDPALRRFINADDPSLITDLSKNSVIGGNIFAYCDNSVIINIDLNGHKGKTIIKQAPHIPKNCWNIIKNSKFVKNRDISSWYYFDSNRKNVSLTNALVKGEYSYYTYYTFTSGFFFPGERWSTYTFQTKKVKDWKKLIKRTTIDLSKVFDNQLTRLIDNISSVGTGNLKIDFVLNSISFSITTLKKHFSKIKITGRFSGYIEQCIYGKKDNDKVPILIAAVTYQNIGTFSFSKKKLKRVAWWDICY